jgi:hypothetical protein
MKTLCLTWILLATCALFSQSQTIPPGAQVTFEQRWPAADPQWFTLVIQSDGSAKYRSLAHPPEPATAEDSAPEPFEFSFTLSPASRQLVFSAAPVLPRFQGTLDKTKVAFTGTKTLQYQDPTGTVSTISYNYSSSPELVKVTELMSGISQSIELSEILKCKLRFDKLSLDSALRGAEERLSFQGFPEPQILKPVLQRIADDPTVMNIARQRARHMLQSSSQQK